MWFSHCLAFSRCRVINNIYIFFLSLRIIESRQMCSTCCMLVVMTFFQMMSSRSNEVNYCRYIFNLSLFIVSSFVGHYFFSLVFLFARCKQNLGGETRSNEKKILYLDWLIGEFTMKEKKRIRMCSQMIATKPHMLKSNQKLNSILERTIWFAMLGCRWWWQI